MTLKRIAVCIVCLLFASTGSEITAARPDTNGGDEEAEYRTQPTGANDFVIGGGYYEYYLNHQSKPVASSQILLVPDPERTLEGIDCAVADPSIEWEIEVPETGKYNIMIEYYPLPGTGKDIELKIYIDGKTPYNELAVFSLPRAWRDARDENGVSILQDRLGNDIRPAQVERFRWNSAWISDRMGLYGDPFYVYLEKGTHTFSLHRVRELVAIKSVLIAARPEPMSHDEYMRKNSDAKAGEGTLAMILGQNAYEKNSPVLAPTRDSADAGMTPSDPKNLRLNSIGKYTWYTNGQSISWQVPEGVEDGFYQLLFRVKQDWRANLSSYRVLYVNGEIPFEEAKCVVFPYSGNWYVHTLFDGLPIRLKSGDVITMEATTGPAQDLLMMVNKTVYELSSIYRKIIGVTTVNPDSFRDYNLEKEIPTLLDDLAQGREYLTEIMDMIVDLMGIQSSQSANLEQFISLLDKVIYSPFLLPENLSSYKSRLDAMAALIWMFNDQEVEVDVGYVKSADMPEVKSNPGFFTRFWFGLRRLYYSFVISYRDVDYGENESGGKQIKVWVAAGRDQSQVMSRLITDTFTPQTGINVTLNLIGSGEPLIQAIMAGRAPDAVVLQTSENIINLAIRGALADLTQWGLTQEIRDRCYPASWVPFTYRGAVYAMPETINYSLLYYRKDVFEELGLSVPQTWDEFYEIIKTLQNHNLTVAMPETDPAAPAISIGISFFDTFLFQRGGRYFNEDYSRTMFDSQEAMEAFEEWVNLYKKYGLDKQLDVYSRVRSGEAPMVIWGQNAYAVLNGIAPELAGLLDIAPIPGRLREDGTIDRSTVASGSGAIVLKLTESRGVAKEAFEFVSWWTSPEVQAAYGLENESIIGITARHYPAQIAAFEMIGWTAAEAAVLKEQWGWVHGVPLVPGSYLIGRSLTSALRSAMDSTYETRRALAIYNRDINYEIERKTREFEQNYE